jgi:putative pyoverdin transport system ATP-binding/permease protein
MKDIFSFLLKASPRIVVLAIVASVLAGVTNTLLLAVISSALSRGDGGAGSLVWAFAALVVAMLVCRVGAMLLLTRLTLSYTLGLRMRLCRQVLATPLRKLEQLGPHRLLANITEDVPAITLALSSIPALCMQIAIVGACFLIMAWFSWKLFLAVIIYLAIGAALYQWGVLRAARYIKLAREGADSLMKHFRALTDGMKELKLHNNRRDAFMNKVLEPTATSVMEYNLQANNLYVGNAASGQLLVFLLIGLLLFGPGRAFQVSTQTLIAYTLLVLYMAGPLEVILNMVPNMNRALVSLQKVKHLGLELSAVPERIVVKPQTFRSANWKSLELDSLTHAYNRENTENTFTLGPINLKFQPQEVVFIVGGNGSGKTTLAKLLIGLYSPEEGEIRFGGKSITDENRDEYRQSFSVVFTDFFLFDSLLGLDNINIDGDARYYLEKLQLDQTVRVSDGVLSTINVSQGQRKRLALLTAYLEDRAIYLFDEWAADQDPVFKEIFYLQLLPELKARGKTVIVISHDDRYYHVADRIIKLDYGRIEYDRKVLDSKNAPVDLSAATVA